MTQGIIYLIINKENGHKYVGQTMKTMNKQWQEHIAESNRMSPTPLHKAFRNYGIHKFTIKQIDECDERLLDEKQEYWIEYYNTICEYNLGFKSKRPIPIVEKPKKKEVEKVKREPWGFMLKENRGNGRHSAKKIMGINVETGEKKIWDSFTDAALEVAGNKEANANIHGAIKNGTKAFGYRWRRLDDSPNKIAVKGVHKKTWAELDFESIIEACRYFGTTNTSGLQNSLRNPHKYTFRGYYWFYN
jgi:group I intron endonuclease